jgi:hypothetical protein
MLLKFQLHKIIVFGNLYLPTKIFLILQAYQDYMMKDIESVYTSVELIDFFSCYCTNMLKYMIRLSVSKLILQFLG